eukprot:929912-Prymnesium_polylepis.2
MAAGSLVIEIHGALKNDFGEHEDYFYHRLCGRDLGHTWLGYAPRYFRPRATQNRIGWEYCSLNGSSSRYEAFVDIDEFTAFFRSALNGERARLARQYAARLKVNPDPRKGRAGARRSAAKIGVRGQGTGAAGRRCDDGVRRRR